MLPKLRRTWTRPPVRMAVLLVALLAPVVACLLSPLSQGVGWLILGLLPAVTAGRMRPRAGFPVALITAAAVVVGLLAGSGPASAVVVMGLAAAAVAASAHYGWNPVATLVAIVMSIVVISSPEYIGAQGSVAAHGSLAVALLVAAFFLVGGLWGAAVTAATIRAPGTARFDCASTGEAVVYGTELVVLVCLGTWVAVSYIPGTRAYWLVLTLFVVLMPTHGESRRRIWERVGGTMAGGVAAAVLIEVVPVPLVLRVFGVVFLILTVVTSLSRPYWLYAASLTGALVLASFSDRASGLAIAAERVGATVAAGLAAVLVIEVVDRLAARARRPA
ncbi:FUSC family protein [Specibacter cremeus]|uniref:FUSC family protein n=1 Tax=Specibacter cremeus TaxID=1629051 RepID=UPI001F0BE5D9|nr:FUSC family protein [Specibacter cremeus]